MCWPSLLYRSCHINKPLHVVSRLSTLKSCHNSTLICGLKASDATQADTRKAVFSLGTPPHPRLMHWPSLLSIKLPHLNPHHVVSRLLILLEQTPGRQSSVLELLPILD
jgi:hypothetical protein